MNKNKLKICFDDLLVTLCVCLRCRHIVRDHSKLYSLTFVSCICCCYYCCWCCCLRCARAIVCVCMREMNEGNEKTTSISSPYIIIVCFSGVWKLLCVKIESSIGGAHSKQIVEIAYTHGTEISTNDNNNNSGNVRRTTTTTFRRRPRRINKRKKKTLREFDHDLWFIDTKGLWLHTSAQTHTQSPYRQMTFFHSNLFASTHFVVNPLIDFHCKLILNRRQSCSDREKKVFFLVLILGLTVCLHCDGRFYAI